MSSFSRATDVTPTGTHTYSAEFSPQWCVGSVPHGGFVASCFLSVAERHFSTTLSSFSQPNAIILHLEFLRRTSIGPATFTVEDAKLGQQTSTIQITLIQESDRKEVIGYVTHTNFSTDAGLSLRTNWRMVPAPAPVDLNKLRSNEDRNWRFQGQMPFVEFRKVTGNIDFFFPRTATPNTGMVDEWMRLKNGERFTSTSLGLVADMFPQLIETFDTEHGKSPSGKYWYPTLVLNIEMKKALPPEGVEFLFVRVRTKEVKNGRFDLEVIIVDEHRDIVAFSHHVSMILNAERNLAERSHGKDGAMKDTGSRL